MKEDQTLIAVMQRMIELNPSDTKTRFSLAFKHSEVGNDELSLFHYLKIPFAARESGTWNNIGVALHKLELEAKSVEAYRKAEEAVETLAMSNLALKFLSEGFLTEARRLCETALAKPECHENVPLTLVQVTEKLEEEEKELNAIMEKFAR